MNENYYFSPDEPTFKNKEIICSFYISNIEEKKCKFFIISENQQFHLYYTMIKDSELIKFIKNNVDEINLNKITLTEIFSIKSLKKRFNDNFLQHKILNNQKYVKKTLEKILKDNIYNANNHIQGLDGFSVELKLKRNEKFFYAWCIADDKRYYYIIDFINSILDELKIDKRFRFQKK